MSSAENPYTPGHINDTIQQRGVTHGIFLYQSRTAQSIKDIYLASPNYGTMEADQKEALDQIAIKIARILNGDPNHADSWTDIAGYSTLVEQRLTKEEIR